MTAEATSDVSTRQSAASSSSVTRTCSLGPSVCATTSTGGARRGGHRTSPRARRWRADDLVIDVATHADGARRLRLEAGGRRWAEARGIATPVLLEADSEGRWTVGAWVAAPCSSGPAYVTACITAAAPASPSRPSCPPWPATRRRGVPRGARRSRARSGRSPAGFRRGCGGRPSAARARPPGRRGARRLLSRQRARCGRRPRPGRRLGVRRPCAAPHRPGPPVVGAARRRRPRAGAGGRGAARCRRHRTAPGGSLAALARAAAVGRTPRHRAATATPSPWRTPAPS